MKMWHNLILVKTLNTVSNKVLLAKWIQIRLHLGSSILYWLKAEGWWQKLRIKAMYCMTEMSASPAPGINEALVLVNSFINDLHDEAKEYLNECYWGNCGEMLWIPVSTERSAKRKTCRIARKKYFRNWYLGENGLWELGDMHFLNLIK